MTANRTGSVPAHRAVIGLDVGTTGVKAVVFWLGTDRRRQTLREYPLWSPAPDQAVQDPDTVRAATFDALRHSAGDLDGAEVAAVALSAAMHGLIGLDRDRTPVTPLITWADGRADREVDDLRGSPAGQQLPSITGAPLHPMTPLAKLLWLARHEPETWKTGRWWIGLKDYLIMSLTGTLATELSSASGTGLLDVRTRAWSPVALGACDLDPDRLPPILSPTAVLPMSAAAARSTGLPAGTPVVVGAADGPLSNLGTGAIGPGVAALSLGTSGAVRMTIGAPHLDRTGALFCYALTESLWVVGGAISNGGDVVRWAGRGLAPDLAGQADATGLDSAILDLAASVPAGSDGLVMLPFLRPERAPIGGRDVAGAYLGMRRDHTRAHLVRAAVEGVSIQMSHIIERIDAVTPVRSIRATGGAFRSELWRQVMAAAAGKPFHVLDGAEGTARGAAAMGLLALDRSLTPAGALALLGFPSTPPPPVEPAADLVLALAGTAARARKLMAALNRLV